MKLIQTLAEMQAIKHPPSAKIGFVPTMGYLHDGHMSLVEASSVACDITVVSIYVNPAQFGPTEDLSSYPRDLDRDLALLQEIGVDYVFFPNTEMMYPAPYRTWVDVDDVSSILCGASRPGHFRGVCTVVLKLVNIVKPHYMYMGEKDFQQLSILRIMLRDLNLCTEIVACPIVREADGLAKSSRNVYLKGEHRSIALCLFTALNQAKQAVSEGVIKVSDIIDAAKLSISKAGAVVDYVEIVDERDFQIPEMVDEHSRMLIAARVGNTRLIDNQKLI